MNVIRTCAAAVVAALLLSGCGGASPGSGEGGTATDVAPSSPEEAAAAGAAETVRITALGDAERDQAVAEVADLLWDGLIEVSGAGEALGESGLADLEAAQEEVAAQVVALESLGESLPEGFTAGGTGSTGRVFLPAEGPGLPSIGALMLGFSEMSLGGQGAVAASNSGGAATGTLSDGAVTVTVERARASFSSQHDKSVGGARLQLANQLSVAPCPDPDGRFEATGRIDARLEAASGGGGGRAEIDLRISGHIDDDARLVDVESEMRMQMSDYLPSAGFGAFLDVTAGFRATGFREGSLAPASVTSTGVTLNRQGGQVNEGLAAMYAQAGSVFGQLLTLEVVRGAQEGWESGRCVDPGLTTEPAERLGLAPSSTVTITADPRSRLDALPTGGTVRAAMADGSVSVTPSEAKVPAVATFTYLAPGKRNDGGQVAFEARSRRGVAKADLTFDTTHNGYDASGGGNGLVVSGTVGYLDRPFDLTGTFPGGSITLSYTPTSETGGTVTYTGGGSGAVVTGSGTYTLAPAGDDVWTLTQTTSGCADVGTCRTQTESITLTPRP